MKIVTFMYCDEVNTDENGRNIIVNPLQMFTPISLPSNYSFTISFGIYDFCKALGNSINVSFCDKDKNVIAENNINLPILPDELKESPNPIGIQINMGFRNIVLESEGEYYTSISVNGEKLGDYSIFVLKGNNSNAG